MLEMLQTGKALYALAAIGAIGAISKLITRSLYKRLIRFTFRINFKFYIDKKQEFEGFETEAGECLPAESEYRQYGSLSGTADVWIPLYENFSEQLE